MGIVSSILLFPPYLYEWYHKINGNWRVYFQLKKQIKRGEWRNSRFRLYNLTDTSNPHNLTILPYDQEWDLECFSKDKFEDFLLYGFNSSYQALILRIQWQPIKTGWVKAKLHLQLRQSETQIYWVQEDAVLCLEQMLDQNGRISEFRIGSLLVQIRNPFRNIRICYRGCLFDAQSNKLIFTRLNFLWACLGKVFDFQQDYDADFMMQQMASKGCHVIERENRFEQWGQVKGTVKIENEDMDTIYLWGVKAKSYEQACQSLRIYGYNIKGFGFHIGSVNFNQNKINYGYLNLGIGSNAALSELTLKDITSQQQIQNREFALTSQEANRTLNVAFGEPVYAFSNHTWLYSLKIDNHEGVALVFCENGENLNFNINLESSSNFMIKTNTRNTEKKFVVKIEDEDCLCESLTGGKGSSLGVLSQLANKSPDQFEIPRGLVVTSQAYQLLLDHNPHLTQHIAALEKHSRECHDTVLLKSECDKFIKVFEQVVLPEMLKREIEDTLSAMFTKDQLNTMMFAVRSSACGEDSEDMSAAGQMSTFLGINNLDSICESVVKCWASQFSLTAVDYKRGYGQPVNSAMAVVVQHMIPCSTAGVIFTCDPVSGNEKYLTITANYGIGESVVSALSEPDTIKLQVAINSPSIMVPRTVQSIAEIKIGSKCKYISVDDNNNSVEEKEVSSDMRERCSLDQDTIMNLGNVALEIQRHYGNGRDIEWGIENGIIYILQSRPITNLDGLTDWELMHELDSGQNSENELFSRANLGEVFAGSTSYIGITWLLNFWKVFGFTLWKDVINLRIDQFNPYFNNGFSVAYNVAFFIMKTGTFPVVDNRDSNMTRGMQLGMFGHELTDEKLIKDSMEKAPRIYMSPWRKIKLGLGMLSMTFFAWYRVLEQKKKPKIRFDLDVEKASSEQLFHLLGWQVDKTLPSYTVHIRATLASMNFNSMLYGFLYSNTQDINQSLEIFSQIVSSAQNVISAEVPVRLAAIAENIEDRDQFARMSDDESIDYLTRSTHKAAVMFRTFLLDYGHRGFKEFDPHSLQWDENPQMLVQTLRTLVSNNNEQLNSNKSDKPKILQLEKFSRFQQFLLQYVFMPLCQNGIRNREESKNLLTNALHSFRKIFWKLGEKLVEEGKIPEKELIFYMTFVELADLIKSANPRIVANAKLRKRVQPKKESLKFHESVSGPEMEPRNLEMPNLDSSEFSRIKGVPVSSGKVIARCCVAFTLQEAHCIQKGDILITFSTDIGWSPYFALLSGLVTEIGGLISHGAVIAREYGLPCLVGVENATQMLKTGDIILLDTEKAEIVKIEHNDIQKTQEDVVERLD